MSLFLLRDAIVSSQRTYGSEFLFIRHFQLGANEQEGPHSAVYMVRKRVVDFLYFLSFLLKSVDRFKCGSMIKVLILFITWLLLTCNSYENSPIDMNVSL